MFRSRAPPLFLCRSLLYVFSYAYLLVASIDTFQNSVMYLETPQPRNQEVDCLLFSLLRYDPYPKEPLTFMRYQIYSRQCQNTMSEVDAQLQLKAHLRRCARLVPAG